MRAHNRRNERLFLIISLCLARGGLHSLLCFGGLCCHVDQPQSQGWITPGLWPWCTCKCGSIRFLQQATTFIPTWQMAPEAFLLPCRPGYRAALKWGTGPQVPADVAALWAACLAAMQWVSQLLSQPRTQSDGVRMLAARFLENAMLLISADPSSSAKAPKAQHALLSAALVSSNLLCITLHSTLTPSIHLRSRAQVALLSVLC